MMRGKDVPGMPPVPVLMYHQVLGDGELSAVVRHTNPAYTISRQRFAEQLAHLADSGFRTLTLEQLVSRRWEGERGVVITFDDGWADNYHQAFPLLRQRGMTATIFVVTGFVGTKGYLTWEEIREMAEAGMDIQSHTTSHRPLGMLTEAEIRHELEDSRNILEDRLGRQVRFVSMPQGVFTPAVLHFAQESGYLGVCTSEPGLRHMAIAPAVLKRINVSGAWDLATFSRIVDGDRSLLFFMVLNKMVKNFIKSLVGYGTYRKLYRLFYGINNSGAGDAINP